MNQAPNNTRDVIEELPSNMYLEALCYLEKVRIIEALEYDVKLVYLNLSKVDCLTFILEDTSLLSIEHMI